MKMRSNLPCSGVFMESAVEEFGEDIPQPHGEEAEQDGEADVGPGIEPLAVPGQVEGLEAERGKGGVAAADADHEKLAGGGAGERAAVGVGPGGEEADDEGAGDIDDEGADREGLAEAPGDGSGEPVAGYSAQGAARGDPEIIHLQRH